MNGFKYLTLVLAFFFQCLVLSAQGLMFKGMESSIEDRTSYDVFVSKTPEFRNVLKIEFSVAMFHPSDFGYILRIKNVSEERIFNLLYSGEKWNSSFPLRLNEEGKSSIIKADIPHDHFKTGKWARISLEFIMREGKIVLKVDDYLYETYMDPMPEAWSPIINFGKSDYMIDVPSMAIKDLSVGDDRRTFRFPLNEFEGTKVRERNKNLYGEVDNAQWLACKSYNWEEVACFTSGSRAGVNYDQFRKSVVYYNVDSISVYNLVNKNSYSRRYETSCPVDMYLGSSFVNPMDSLLYVYEPFNENPARATVASYDYDENGWSVCSYDNMPIRFHHHSSFFDEHKEKYVLFGGFGSMSYNGDFYSYDLDSNCWQMDSLPSGDRIYPRYFTSLGYDSEEYALYVFGGMGNESGEQIVGRHYFYDLHKVDLKTGENTQIWGKDVCLDWKEENMVPVRNMIVHDGGFYTVCYPEFYTNSYLQLFYFDIENCIYTKFCNKVPIRSDKMSTNANLYFDKDLLQLVLTVMESPDDVQSRLKVYTLSFPPLTETEYLALTNESHLWFILLLIFCLLSVCVAIILYKVKRKDCHDADANHAKGGRKRYFIEQKPNSICLFGGFSAFDVNGNDVPFPYQQKKLFCLILKYSLDSGISSNRLSRIMWPDKSEDKVKNSRGVAINHLRRLLENFHGVSLVFEDSHFKLQFLDNFFCDWIEFKRESISENPDIGKIMSIASRGKFMPFIEDPVFDSFKEGTETALINMLCAQLPKSYAARQYQTVADIADVLVYTDPLNEQALKWHLNALVKIKRTEDALVRYAAFVKDYKASYDADYEHDFKSLTQMKVRD